MSPVKTNKRFRRFVRTEILFSVTYYTGFCISMCVYVCFFQRKRSILKVDVCFCQCNCEYMLVYVLDISFGDILHSVLINFRSYYFQTKKIMNSFDVKM